MAYNVIIGGTRPHRTNKWSQIKRAHKILTLTRRGGSSNPLAELRKEGWCPVPEFSFKAH